MSVNPKATEWLHEQFRANRLGPLPCYAVYRHQQTQIDYIFRAGLFRTIWSPDHYFFLAYGGLIGVPHGQAQQVETNYVEFLRSEALTFGGETGVDPIIYADTDVTARMNEGAQRWAHEFAPDEGSLRTIRQWAVENGFDLRGQEGK